MVFRSGLHARVYPAGSQGQASGFPKEGTLRGKIAWGSRILPSSIFTLAGRPGSDLQFRMLHIRDELEGSERNAIGRESGVP